MSRRRRLALRQVAEPEMTAALSDMEEDTTSVIAEPNFNLLGMMQVEEAAVAADPSPPPPTALLVSTQPVVYVDEDGDHEMDHSATQVMPSPSRNGTSPQATKKARMETGRAAPSTNVANKPPVAKPQATSDSSNGVFQLYQTGLCDDHILRLHFIRRKPPPPPAMRVEHEFVLPRPQLHLFDLLPIQSTRISDILRSSDAVNAPEGLQTSTLATDEILRTAIDHWRHLATAPAEIVVSWRQLLECDWIQVFEVSGSHIPAPEDVIRLLETLRSDAFATFVWRELLVPTMRTLVQNKATLSPVSRLVTALLNHDTFHWMPAKEFRTQLRAKNLRALSDASLGVGATMEMALIDQFHKFRNHNV